MTPKPIKLVLLAAGASRRMNGRDKLLETIEGLPLLRRQALAALAARIGPVAVTLPTESPDRHRAVADLDVTLLTVPDAHTGMSASLRAAAKWAQGAALMICPADMPDVTAQDFATMAAGYKGQALCASDIDGKAGHPVVFPPQALPMFEGLNGDTGARGILRRYTPQSIALPAHHATTDLDTPEAWAKWRRENPSA